MAFIILHHYYYASDRFDIPIASAATKDAAAKYRQVCQDHANAVANSGLYDNDGRLYPVVEPDSTIDPELFAVEAQYTTYSVREVPDVDGEEPIP